MTRQVRLLAFDEYPAVAEFIHQQWKKGHVYTHDKALFDWTFNANPYWTTKSHYSISVVEHEDSGIIAGMLGTIPFELNNHGASSQACWLVNWLLVEQARKGRSGLALLDLFSRGYGFDTISFGINDTIAKLYKALRWHQMPPIPRMQWIDPEKTEAVRTYLLAALPLADVGAVDDWMVKAGNAMLGDAPAAVGSLGTTDPDAWDRHGWMPWAMKTIGCARNHAYLGWRYLQHPTYRYDTAVIADKTRLGLVVWRVETPFMLGADGVRMAFAPVVRIVEFLPASEANARQLMGHCLRAARAAGALTADFYGYCEEVMGILQKLGFLVATGDSAVALPNLTQPIDIGSGIRSAVKIAGRGEEPDGDWYWTRSDSDQDRPNGPHLFVTPS
jgi:hypothetical protein